MSYPVETATADVRRVLEPVLAAVWLSLGYGADTIDWPNTYFQKPGNGPWMRVAWPQLITSAMTWGGPGNVVQNQTIGILALQVFTPRNTGDAVLIAATDAFRAALERRSFGAGIRFREATGPNDTPFEPQWAGRAFTFPYEYYEDLAL